MDAECQLSLKHLFPANNSLCRCLVLAEGSPIASSLLTQNNNADECHLLVMFFSIVSQVQCFLHRGSIYGTTIIAYVTGSAAIGRGVYSKYHFLCWQLCCLMCWMGWGWQPVDRWCLILASLSLQPAVHEQQCEMWAGLLLRRWRSLPCAVSSLSSSFLNSTAIIPITSVLGCHHCVLIQQLSPMWAKF